MNTKLFDRIATFAEKLAEVAEEYRRLPSNEKDDRVTSLMSKIERQAKEMRTQMGKIKSQAARAQAEKKQ